MRHNVFNKVRRCANILRARLRALLPVNSSYINIQAPLPPRRAKSSLCYNSSALIFMRPWDTKYNPNSISNLPIMTKVQLIVHMFNTYRNMYWCTRSANAPRLMPCIPPVDWRLYYWYINRSSMDWNRSRFDRKLLETQCTQVNKKQDEYKSY